VNGNKMPWFLGGYMWLYLHRPFEFWPDLGAIQIERMYMIALLVIWVVYAQKSLVLNRVQLGVAMLILCLAICWVNTPYSQGPGYKIIEDHFKVGVFFFLLLTSIKDQKTLKQMLIIYFICLAIYQGHSLFEFANGRYEYRMKTIRMKGVDETYGDPNTFAATILHAFPFLLPLWLSAESPKTRKWIIAYVLMGLLCIVLTGSRRAFVGLAFLIVILIMYSPRPFFYGMLVMAISPLAFLVMRDDLQTRFTTIIDPSVGPSNAQTSANSRWQFFLDSLNLFEKYPITGVGPANFGVGAGHGMQPHNLYAQTIGELGAVGIAAVSFMVLMYYLNFREVTRIYNEHPWWEKDFSYYTVRAGWLAIILMLFMGLGGHNLYRYNWMWFGAFQAIALYCVRQRVLTQPYPVEPDPEPEPRGRFVGYRYAA